MNPFRTGHGVETLAGSSATIDQARRAMRHLESLLRMSPATAITGPADIYLVLGFAQQIVAAWQASSCHLEAWLDQQHDSRRLVVTDGPFAGDTSAAVATLTAALEDTRRACTEAQAALERAQLAIAGISAPEPARARRRR